MCILTDYNHQILFRKKTWKRFFFSETLFLNSVIFLLLIINSFTKSHISPIGLRIWYIYRLWTVSQSEGENDETLRTCASVFSFFFLGLILLLCESMYVCLCDYNTFIINVIMGGQHDEH